MRTGAVYDASTERCIVPEVWQTANARERMRGLLGRPALTEEQGIWIEPCSSIHTIGMRYPIDVIFMNKSGVVKKVSRKLKSFRFTACSGTRSTLELKSGRADSIGIQEGMSLYWKIGN